jgi:hypothetical protein
MRAVKPCPLVACLVLVILILGCERDRDKTNEELNLAPAKINLIKTLSGVSCYYNYTPPGYGKCTDEDSEAVQNGCLNRGYVLGSPDTRVLSARSIQEPVEVSRTSRESVTSSNDIPDNNGIVTYSEAKTHQIDVEHKISGKCYGSEYITDLK